MKSGIQKIMKSAVEFYPSHKSRETANKAGELAKDLLAIGCCPEGCPEKPEIDNYGDLVVCGAEAEKRRDNCMSLYTEQWAYKIMSMAVHFTEKRNAIFTV
ncbi:hypothetical protein GPECTOR_146g7 [Gonium pectorale]|uniref:Uncharacterized protein n=1 Tax=Gonium pectorale TaxID=33097 RepID=A0A150FXU8_GONPE|nr:hypothetical protein GPECTOR_146g7 [Gonium pectorale]|eukprot:KXZ42442.1 hypothetical protein GPECTOR_146g7 [Gonium pectorale]